MTTTGIQSFAPSTSAVLGGGQNYLVSRCDDHGTKECSDFESFARYVEVSRACQAEVEDIDHQRWHYEEGHSCWVEGKCCVVDPYGFFD